MIECIDHFNGISNEFKFTPIEKTCCREKNNEMKHFDDKYV